MRYDASAFMDALMFKSHLRDDVFVAGGQPSITYVKREETHIERQLARAIATPNRIVSLSGPTKTGKTVLCRKVLGQREYVWIDGGEVKSDTNFWDQIRSELRIATETTVSDGTDSGVSGGVNFVVTTANGSHLMKQSETKKFNGGLGEILDHLQSGRIIVVVDDFHYIEKDHRVTLMRNMKGAVFNGLKVVLLSVTHRTFDAIEAETELTGRFSSVILPPWSRVDLEQIPRLGFDALNVKYGENLIGYLSGEAQESPFLMQKFCWEICFDSDIESSSMIIKNKIDFEYDIEAMFTRLAKDAGLPVYQKLVTGPQSRKIRTKRPLHNGNEADIYEATLLAIAETGPMPTIKYDDLRSKMNNIIEDKMPQKHEITSALKHLAAISRKSGAEDAIDWDEDKREIRACLIPENIGRFAARYAA